MASAMARSTPAILHSIDSAIFLIRPAWRTWPIARLLQMVAALMGMAISTRALPAGMIPLQDFIFVIQTVSNAVWELIRTAVWEVHGCLPRFSTYPIVVARMPGQSKASRAMGLKTVFAASSAPVIPHRRWRVSVR